MSTAASAAALLAGFPSMLRAAEISTMDFLQLSQLLTAGKTLDPAISERALAALTAGDAGFATKAAALSQAIAAEGFSDMREWSAFSARHPEMADTGMKVISAWYLGYTGTPKEHSSVDDAQFVAYHDALMYQPTIDATVVPSYARGATNYWVNPPATIAND